MNREEIKRLAREAEIKRQIYEGHRMANVPTDSKDKIKQAEEYAIVQAEYYEAQRLLDKAIRGQ